MSKFFIQKFQLSEKEIINGVEHWNSFEVGKPDKLKITDCGSKIVMTHSGKSNNFS